MKNKKKYLNKRVILSLVFQLIMIFTTFLLIVQNFEATEDNLRMISLYGTIIFIILIVFWKYIGESIISPFIFFFTAFFLFQFGQCFLFIFDLDVYLKVFEEHSYNLILNGSYFTIISIQFFYFGACLPHLKKNHNYDQISVINNYSENLDAMKKVGWFLLILSAPVKIYYTLIKTIASLKYGYMNLYSYQETSILNEPKIYTLLSPLFLVSFILLIISYKDNRIIMKRLIIGLLLFSFIDFLAGGRSLFIASVITVICMIHLFIKRFSSRNIIIIIMIFLIIVTSVPFMAHWRLQEEKSAEGILESIQYIKTENPVISTINELGGSMAPLLYTIKAIPEFEGYKYGESYLASISSIVPNIFNFMGEVHPAAEKSHLAQWLMGFYNMPQGPGFSMISESYYNWGYFGGIIHIFWGILFGVLLKIDGKSIIQKNPTRLFVVFATLILFFTFPRGQSLDFFRNFTYYILGCFILVKLYIILKKK